MINVDEYINKFIQNGTKRGEFKRVKYVAGVLYYEDEETSGLGELIDIYDTLTGKILKRKKVENIERY